jgi:hypothetical protein
LNLLNQKKRLTISGKPHYYKYRFILNKTFTAYQMIGYSNDGRDVLVRNSFY